MSILVLNAGLKNVRAIAFAFDGRTLADVSRPICTYVSNESVEQDTNELWSLCCHVLGEATAALGQAAQDIRYLTVTTSASCLAVLDAGGRSLRNTILVSDTRAIHEARLLSNTVEFHAVQAAGGSKSSPDLMLPKIMWLARHEPGVFERAAHFVNVGDYLVGRLTGEYVTDPNNAIKFHYLVGEGRYPTPLLESLGIEASMLPGVHPQGTRVGSLLGHVAAELRIPKSCTVVLSTYDALAAVTGAGAFKVGEAVDVSGTVTSFRTVTDHHLFDPRQRIYVTPHIGRNRWLAGGSNNLGGGTIEWLRQLLFEHDDDAYAVMEELAKHQPVCPGGLVFLPHLFGERAPIWNPDCRGVFFGLNRSHTKAHLVRAVFEGVGFSVAHIAAVLREFHLPVHCVTAAGGLSRLNTVTQIKADILGVPMKKFQNFETSAIGAALIALVGVGEYDSVAEAFHRFCQIDRVFEPDSSRHAMYREYFHLYLQVYEALTHAYKARADLQAKLQHRGINEFMLAENL